MGYNIFISWSGERSRLVAESLRDWLPIVIQAAKPWMSAADIEKGSRGLSEIAKALDGIKVGILCLTPENLKERWILYEAGALSKSIDATRLCTYLLCGLQPQEVESPLGMFQATKAEKEDTRKLIQTINHAVGDDPVPEKNLNALFDVMWPRLESVLRTLPAPTQKVEHQRTTEDMVAELLELARAEANRRRKLDHLDAYLPVFEDLFPLLQEVARAAKKSVAPVPPPTALPELQAPTALPAPLPQSAPISPDLRQNPAPGTSLPPPIPHKVSE